VIASLKIKCAAAQYGKSRGCDLSAVGGEAFRSLVTLAIYDTDKSTWV